mgnify:CR=1 FL=1
MRIADLLLCCCAAFLLTACSSDDAGTRRRHRFGRLGRGQLLETSEKGKASLLETSGKSLEVTLDAWQRLEDETFRLADVVHAQPALLRAPQARIGRRHLRHGQACAELLAQLAKRLVGHAGHGGQHDVGLDPVGADLHGRRIVAAPSSRGVNAGS